MLTAMKRPTLLLLLVPFAFACDPTEVSCGMLIRDDVRGACVCPPGVEVDYDRWLCLFPDAAVPIEPFDAGGLDGGLDGGSDSGADSGADVGPDTGPECTPSEEVCDGTLDEDCDGDIDEGCDCEDGATRACGTDLGVCDAGTETCEAGAWAECEGAVPGTETCDGELDEDCDGSVDEGCACANGASRACPGGIDTGDCEAGTQSCTDGMWGGCEGAVGPTSEVCDGRDNDCDGVIDGAVASAACGSAANATSLSCSAGECVVVGCLGGTGDCNRDVSDGCEADLESTRATCGSCGRACSPTQVCSSSACTNAPLLENHRAGIARAETYFVEEAPGGDWSRTSLQLGAEADGSAVIVESYIDLGGDGTMVRALDSELNPGWVIYRATRMLGPACSAAECMVTTLNDDGDDYLARYALTSGSPTRVEVALHRRGVAPPVRTPDGRWAHVASAFDETFGLPDLRVTGPTDGRVAAMGRTDVVYTTMNARQVRATRLDGAARWTFSMPSGWTVRDIVAGPSIGGGLEAFVYVLSTRSFGSRFETRLSVLDANDGSESESYDLTSATVSFEGVAVALGGDGNVYMVGRTASKSLLVAFGPDASLLYQREAGGTAYSRFNDIVSLPSGELLVLGLLTSGTFAFGGSTFGSGSPPSNLTDSPEGEQFILRLRVE